MSDLKTAMNRLRGAAVGLRISDMPNAALICDDAASAIENALRPCVNYEDHDCDSLQLCTCYGIVRQQMDLLKAAVPKWFDSRERLPEPLEMVLCFYSYIPLDCVEPISEFRVACQYKGIWSFETTQIPLSLFWTHLPDPPAKEVAV